MKRDPNTDALNFWQLARDYLHVYLPTIRKLSVKTVEAYRISLECFIDFLTDHHNIDRQHLGFDQFDRHYLKMWLTWMSTEKHYAPRTIGLRLTAVKAFLAYAAQEDIQMVAIAQAAKSLRPPAAPRTPVEYLTESETRAILGAFTGQTIKSRRNRMLLIMLYDTAARVSELTGLQLQDLVLTEPGRVTLTGKGNRTRVVPLTAKTIEHLQVYLTEFHPNIAKLPADRPLFYSLHRGHPVALSPDTVTAVLKKAASIARSDRLSIPESIHCHMLRKTKAMDLYQQGIPLPLIMRLLGHEQATTTSAFYAFATLDMMREAVNAATPTVGALATQPLTQDQIQTLYSLK